MTDTLKQLNREKYQLEIKIEKAANDYMELNRKNEELKKVQEELKLKEKNINSEYLNYSINEKSVQNNKLKEDESLKSKDDIVLVNDPKVIQLKEELKELDIMYDSKNEFLKQLRDQTKNTVSDYDNMQTSMNEIVMLDNETVSLEKQIVEIEKELGKMENKEFSECITQYSKFKELQLKYEKNIDMMKINLERTNKQIRLVEKNIDEIESTKETLNNSLAEEFIKKKELEYSLEELRNNVDDIKTLIQNCENEIDRLNDKVIVNRDMLDTNELEIQHIYYFIRYSNSLINSVFNIVNTRRIQIELVSKFDMNPTQMNKEVFEKLDKMEIDLFDEYKLVLQSFKKEVFNKKKNTS